MSDRADELRWRWRLLALDILLAIATKVDVGPPLMRDLDERARRIKREIER